MNSFDVFVIKGFTVVDIYIYSLNNKVHMRKIPSLLNTTLHCTGGNTRMGR